MFQSTLPRRERPGEEDAGCRGCEFQSTLPRRERPLFEYRVYIVMLFQSTLPRRERPDVDATEEEDELVSIHAPT